MVAGKWLQESLPWEGLQEMRILQTYSPKLYHKYSGTIYFEIGAIRRSLSNYVCYTTIIRGDQVNIVLSHVTTDSRMEPHVRRNGRRKEKPMKGLIVLERKQVIIITTFYRYIFLVYHLVLLILIVSYDALDMNSTWYIEDHSKFGKWCVWDYQPIDKVILHVISKFVSALIQWEVYLRVHF